MDSNKKLVAVIEFGRHRDLMTQKMIMTALISAEVRMRIMIFNGVTIADGNA